MSSAENINITLSVPAGSTTHGNPHLLCTPPQWTDLVIFYFSNYFAHAATIITSPGQTLQETIEASLFAFLLPISGLARAVGTTMRCTAFEKDPIKRAVRASALCIVARKERPTGKTAQGWWDISCRENPRAIYELVHQRNAKVYGQYQLSKGYVLVRVPMEAPLTAAENDQTHPQVPHFLLASSYSIPKLLISLIQAIWASVTLYRARGDQVDAYGYAAFGLTVAQYAFMSVVNIIGNLMCPEYSLVFMVRTPLMDEAEKDGSFFSGDLTAKIGDTNQDIGVERSTVIAAEVLLAPLLGFVPLAVVGGLTGFRKRQSTSLERGFTMTWLVASMAIGPVVRMIHRAALSIDMEFLASRIVVDGCIVVFFGGPAIGGMVIVGHMIRSFGVCNLLG